MKKSHWRADAVAGLTTAISGDSRQHGRRGDGRPLNPAQGLYAGMIASPVGAGLSSSAYMMITTTSAMALTACRAAQAWLASGR